MLLIILMVIVLMVIVLIVIVMMLLDSTDIVLILHLPRTVRFVFISIDTKRFLRLMLSRRGRSKSVFNITTSPGEDLI